MTRDGHERSVTPGGYTVNENGNHDAAWWSERLAARYFNPQFAGEPVTLAVDDDELAAIAGSSADAAAADLADAVRSQVMPGYHFGRVWARSRRWQDDGAADAPPSLPLLALNALVASRMSSHGRQGKPNFYKPFRRLLDPGDDTSGMPGDYDQWVPRCWEQLRWWLETHLDGKRGIPTITKHSVHVNIGYAEQQSLVRNSDRRLLFRFFHAMRIEPDDDAVSTGELRRALAFWSKRLGPRGSRLHRLATQDSLERYADALLRIMLFRWDGRLRDERTGAHAVALKLVITPDPFGLGFVALAESVDLPRRATVCLDGEQPFELDYNEDQCFDPRPLPIPVDSAALREGVVATSEELGLFFGAADIYAFRRDEPRLHPDWVSTRRISFGDRHLLLARSEWRSALVDWLCAEVSAEGDYAPEAQRRLPDGWSLFRNVRVNARPKVPPPSALADLLGSSGGLRSRLVGGLRVEGFRRVYLTGGAPLLALADESPRHFTLAKSGHEPIERTAAGGEFPLGALSLGAGEYAIEHDGRTIAFEIIDGLQDNPSNAVGRIKQLAPDGRAASGLSAQGPKAAAPIVVPVKREKPGILVGSGPDDVGIVEFPMWLEDVLGGVSSWASIDTWTGFEPVWWIDPDTYTAFALGMHLPVVVDGPCQRDRLLRKCELADESAAQEQALWVSYQDDVR